MIYTSLEEYIKPEKKPYLVSPETDNPLFKSMAAEAFKTKKQKALWELQADIDNTTTFHELYLIFRDFRNAKEGMLRYRREHLLGGYKDTKSYKEAYLKIYDKTNNMLPKTFAEFNLYLEILLEGGRLGYDFYQGLDTKKQAAYACLENEINSTSTLSKAIEYIAIVLNPYSILRIHRKNIQQKYGATTTYKKALQCITMKICSFDKVFSIVEQTALQQLYNALEQNLPYFELNNTWADLLKELGQFIAKANLQPSTNNNPTFS